MKGWKPKVNIRRTTAGNFYMKNCEDIVTEWLILLSTMHYFNYFLIGKEQNLNPSVTSSHTPQKPYTPSELFLLN